MAVNFLPESGAENILDRQNFPYRLKIKFIDFEKQKSETPIRMTSSILLSDGIEKLSNSKHVNYHSTSLPECTDV